MTKTPPKQRTFSAWSNPDLTIDENFKHLKSFFLDYASGLAIENSRVLTNRTFSYFVRLTKTVAGELIWHKSDSYSITLNRIDSREKLVSVIMCVSGKVVLSKDGVSHTLKPGSFVILNSERLSTITLAEYSEIIVITVSENYFFTHSGFHAPTCIGAIFTCESPVQRFFARQLKSIVRDAGNLDARDVESVFDGVFCFLRPVLSELNRFSLSMESGCRSKDDLRAAAIEVMQKCYKRHNLSVKYIAEKIGISERYLSALFRENGTTVMKTLYEIRVRRASVLLREEHAKNMSVQDIAKLNGFKSSTHFCRRFREFFQMTPMDWRSKHLH